MERTVEMAQKNVAKAKEAYGQATIALRSACIVLERSLPPADVGDDGEPLDLPPNLPLRPRVSGLAAECGQCVEELSNLDPGEKEAHRCTHKVDNRDETGSQAGGEPAQGINVQTRRHPRKRQPNPGVVCQDLEDMKTKFDACSGAFARLSPLLDDVEFTAYEEHLEQWTDYYGWMKERTQDLLDMLGTAGNAAVTTTTNIIS